MAYNHKRCLTAGVLLFGLSAGSIAQVGQKVYLDGNYSIVNSPEVARYYSEAMHGETGHLLVRIYHTEGTLKMEGSYLAATPDVPDGFFTYYYRNGQVESQGEYLRGRKAGTWKRWAWDGTSKPDRIYPEPQTEMVVGIPAQFPGGYEALLNFVEAKTVYPQQALAKRITGMVKISFRIDEGGLVRDVEVVERNASILADAALECIWDMPLWEPASRNGTEVSAQFIIPFTFIIEDDKGLVKVGS